MTFDHWENDILSLPLKKGAAQFAKELTASGFEQVQVAAIVYMVAERALSVGDPMRVAKNGMFNHSVLTACSRSIAACTAWRASNIWRLDSWEGGFLGSLLSLFISSRICGVRFCKLAMCFSHVSFLLAHAKRSVR